MAYLPENSNRLYHSGGLDPVPGCAVMAVRMNNMGSLCGLAALLVTAPLVWAAEARGSIRHDVVFTHYGEVWGNRGLARRLLSPATAARLERQVADSGKTLSGQHVDLAAERFVV